MTTKILMKEQIKTEVLRVLSGYCFEERHTDYPEIIILCPWIRDVQLEIEGNIPESMKSWFLKNYGIASINLPYALLLLKLYFGAKITVVTLPPAEKDYGHQFLAARNLLDFFDEIGCKVYINPDLHSKLFLSNDLALLGSFNLSFPALWGREEIGVSIDDIENLKILERYAAEVISSSKAYGYTCPAKNQRIMDTERVLQEMMKAYRNKTPVEDIYWTPVNSITKGLLFDEMVSQASRYGFHERARTFLSWHLKVNTAFETITLAADNINGFYVNVILEFLKHTEKKRKLHFLRDLLDYQGGEGTNEILEFIEKKFARSQVPHITPKIVKMQPMR